MPEKRLQKTRETLPEGYQFGDAKPLPYRLRFIEQYDIIVKQQPTRIAWRRNDGC